MKSLKIPKGYSKAAHRRRTNNDLQNITQKTKDRWTPVNIATFFLNTDFNIILLTIVIPVNIPTFFLNTDFNNALLTNSYPQ